MDEQSEQTTETTTQSQATSSQTETTQPQAVNVDMAVIEQKAQERAERAAQTVVKDMLKQQGLDDTAIQEMLTEYKAKQTTPEQELQKRDETIGTLQQQLENERQEKIALSKGVPLGIEDEATKEKVNACLTLAKSYISDDVAFDVALDKALKVIGFEQRQQAPPPMYAGAGKIQVSATEAETIINNFKEASKNGNSAEMSRLTRLAHEKKVKLI